MGRSFKRAYLPWLALLLLVSVGATSTQFIATGSGVLDWLATPSSANLATAVTGETGSGALVFGTSPGFTTGAELLSTATLTFDSANSANGGTIQSTANNLAITADRQVALLAGSGWNVTASGNALTLANGMYFSIGLQDSSDPRLYRDTNNVFGVRIGSGGGSFAFIPNAQAQFTANQNDLALTNRSYFQRWTSDASRDVTGIVAGASGEVHVIVNAGSNNIVIKHDVTSTAANRFSNSTGADITLGANEAADILYDATTARWRVWKR